MLMLGEDGAVLGASDEYGHAAAASDLPLRARALSSSSFAGRSSGSSPASTASPNSIAS